MIACCDDRHLSKQATMLPADEVFGSKPLPCESHPNGMVPCEK
jgi:hypothetical protein